MRLEEFKQVQHDKFVAVKQLKVMTICCTGDFVKVEADRGEDLGVVCGKIACSDFREEKPTAGYRGRGHSVMQGISNCT